MEENEDGGIDSSRADERWAVALGRGGLPSIRTSFLLELECVVVAAHELGRDLANSEPRRAEFNRFLFFTVFHLFF